MEQPAAAQSPGDPHAEYRRRLEAKQAAAEAVRRKDSPIASAGLWCVTGFFAAVFAWIVGWLPGLAVFIPVAAAFVFLLVHNKLAVRLAAEEFGVKHYERGLARIENRWSGTGRTGRKFEDARHPYAADLDLFGKGSLFELLCTVQTGTGEKALAGWLLEPAAPAELRARQEAVSELRGRLDLREELSLLAGEADPAVRPDDLIAWGTAPSVLTGTGLRVAAWVLPLAGLGTLAAWLLMPLAVGGLPFAGVVLVLLTFLRWTRERVERAVGPAERAERELIMLSSILARMERETFTGSRLRALQDSLRTDGAPASASIAALSRRVQILQAFRNELFRPLGGMLLWRLHFAFSIDRWRARFGSSIAQWLAAVGDMEAHGALAGYAYEHPRDPFPEIVEEGPLYEGEQLGHPLLPDASCVRNDVALGRGSRVLMVSGSNMSGKSTLLRTVGVNAVLAFAGAPVRARRLVISPLSIGATIRIQDSLQAGMSRFYAEINRLKQVMDLASGPRPLLFLLEEILHGTNSKDRKIGAELVIKALVERNAVGLVTTHDLALAASVETLGEKGGNVHFEDQLVDGKLAFDYTLRPGVVQKSNALDLMRSVGLPV